MKNLGYSQNFLVNKKLVERLISKSNIDVTDYVIEIGPGKGIITDVLSQHVVVKHFCNTLFENSPGISSFKWCFPIIVGMRTDMIVPYVHISV